MTEVTIIEIDLGIEIDDIIAKNAEALSDKSKKDLDLAIQIAKDKEKVRERLKAEKENANDALSMGMEFIYNKLVDSMPSGVPCEEVMEILKDSVANQTAFTIRMRKILRDRGNPYFLSRKKISGVQYYIFAEFNGEES
jgi:FKBP-type peptidyl-prolyl cis-trans isomerase (trigger factor)